MAKKKKEQSKNWLDELVRFQTKYASESSYKTVFHFISGLAFITLFFSATQTGINGDDDVQVPYSQKVIDFYATNMADTAVLNSKKGPAIRYYGGGFELISGLTNKSLGFEPDERAHHITRHLLIALLGFLTILGVGLWTKILSNWKVASLAVLFLWLSPRFFGHAVMNPKDIPFAAGYVMSSYFMFLILKHFHKVNWSHIIGLTLSLGYVLSVRSGGLLVFIYYGLFAFTLLFLFQFSKSYKLPPIKTIGLNLGIPLVGGFGIGILLWPYGLLSPIKHTIESLTTFSNFPVAIRVLFAGDMVMSTEIPLQYLMNWMGLTVPLFFFAGLVLLIFRLRSVFKLSSPFLILASAFVFVFPLFYVLYKDSPLYDGWRHFNFAYASSIPLVALGFERGWDWVDRKWKKVWIFPIILFLFAVEPAIHILRNISYPYVYFNPIAGGVSGAFGNYELDYWGISTRQAVEFLEKEGVLSEGMEEGLKLRTNFSYSTRNWLDERYRDKVALKFSRYRERYSEDWDYAIYVSRFMDGAHMKAIDWPGSTRVIKEIKVNGVPIAAIYEKGASYAFEGMKAMRAGQADKAISLFQQEILYDPKNEIAYNALGSIYLNQSNYQEAMPYLEKALELDPDNQQNSVNLALALANTGRLVQAQNLLQDMVDEKPSSYLGYYYLALFAMNSNQNSSAARYIEQCVQSRPNFKQAYLLGAQIYQKIGDQARAQYFNNIANQLR